MNYVRPDIAARGGDALSNAAPAFKAVSRLGAVGGAVGFVFSATDSVQSFQEGDALSGISSGGSALMSAGAVALAIPGGQAIGAGLIATGALLSAGAGAVKLWRNRKKIISGGKEIANSVAKTGKKAVDGAVNLFKSVKSFFGG